MKKSIYILLCIFLSACAGTATTPAAPTALRPFDSATPEMTGTPTVTMTATLEPSSTPTPPAPTEVLQQDLTEQAYDAQATKIAEFPVNCKDFSINILAPSPISADGNWLAISCDYKHEQTLEIVKQNGKRWVLQFKDFLAKEFITTDGIPMGGLYPTYWSRDGGYLYFTSYINYDGGGTCFYGYGDNGLFRIDLNTGTVSTVLPTTTSHIGYLFAFSPTGRRLAYKGDRDPVILDLQTGDEIKINIENQEAGNLTWSPDGLELAYSTCKKKQDGDLYSVDKSAIKVFSIKANTSRTIIETEKNMLIITSWDANNIMKIIQGDYDYDQGGQLFDLNSSQWITPIPKP
jgi:hypothetical protein